jgi:hypothetical protein
MIMIGQETREVERKILTILRILSQSNEPMGSRVISKLLEQKGISLGERAVRYHLKTMDERGLTRSIGRKDGRIITPSGLQELKDGLVTDKLGFINSRIEYLAYQTNFGLRSASGRVPIDLSVFDRNDLPRAIKMMKPIFETGICSSNLLTLVSEGTKVGDLVIPPGKIGLITLCDTVIAGCFLKGGIPVYPRFGGLLQFKSGQPFRFVDLIEFAGTSINPPDIFIAAKMTSVSNVAAEGHGKVLATYYEIPSFSAVKAEAMLQHLKNNKFVNSAYLASPGETTFEIYVGQDRAGLVTLSGMNPAAAAAEGGIELSRYPMCSMLEVNRLSLFADLI